MPNEPKTTNPGPLVLAEFANPSVQSLGAPGSLKEQPIGFRSISGLSTYLDPIGQHEAQFFSDILEITHSAALTTARIVRPNAVGDSAGWTPSAGANWENVDEATADDDTTYNSTSTQAALDFFNFPNLSPTLPTGAVISKVVQTIRARKAAAGSTQQIRVYMGITGIGNSSQTITLTDDTSYYNYEVTWETDKANNIAWTEANFNLSQWGYDKLDAVASALRVTHLYVTVYYYITPSGTRGSTGLGKGYDWAALYAKRSAGLDADTAAVNNSETLVNISELFATVGAGRNCAFNAWMFYDAATAADIKFTIAIPADATAYLLGIGPSTAIAAAIGDAAFRYSVGSGTPTAIAFGGAGVGTILVAHLFGRCSFVTQGELQLQFAQNTADISDAIVRAGSYLDVELQ